MHYTLYTCNKKSYPHSCPSTAFSQTCRYKLRVAEVRVPTGKPALEWDDGPVRACCSLPAPDLGQPSQNEWAVQNAGRSAKEAIADGNTDKYLLQPSRNTRERAACASIRKRQPTRNMLKELFPKGRINVRMGHLKICRRLGITSSFLLRHWRK